MSKITIFLVSSEELESERCQFENFISQRNKSLYKENLFIEVIAWENSISNAMSQTRLQDKYNIEKTNTSSKLFFNIFFNINDIVQ